MSLAHHVFNTAGVPGVAVSSTTAYTSDPTPPRDNHLNKNVIYTIKLTGTPVGTLLIQISTSTDAEVAAGTDEWNTYDLIASTAVSGAASYVRKLTNLPADARFRVKYTNASSTGTIYATVAP